MIAGVSASWYTWLEQGRDITVSESVIDAIGSALQLDDVERLHLYRLSGINPPRRAASATDAEAARLYTLVDNLSDPAYVLDRHWNIMVANGEAQTLLGVRSGSNRLFELFESAVVRRRYVHWENQARQAVGRFRVQAAQYPDDPEFTTLVDELRSRNVEFAGFWDQHETCGDATTKVEIRTGRDEIANFDRMFLGFVGRADLQLNLFTHTEC